MNANGRQLMQVPADVRESIRFYRRSMGRLRLASFFCIRVYWRLFAVRFSLGDDLGLLLAVAGFGMTVMPSPAHHSAGLERGQLRFPSFQLFSVGNGIFRLMLAVGARQLL